MSSQLPRHSSCYGQAVASTDTRICSRCVQELPLTEFRFRSRVTGERMYQCRSCHADLARMRRQSQKCRDDGWLLQKTASQVARSHNIDRSLSLLEHLVSEVGGPRKLIQLWRAECLKLTDQRRSSTRLARMYEMLVVLAVQVRHSSP
jgi:hypothetical protein